MSPPGDIRAALRRFHRRRLRRWGSSRAAMAIIMVSGADGPAVLLTRRPDSVGTGRGQLALPSVRTDRWEPASAAARGRLAESLRIHLPPEAMLGALDDYIAHNSVVITPIVLWAGPISAQQGPVTGVLAVSFTDLDVEPVFLASTESDHPMIRLPLNGEWLHAPTAAVLHQFRELVLHHRPTRVAHLAPIPHSAGLAGSIECRYPR